MSTQFDEKVAELSEQIKNDLGGIEMNVIGNYTLADAMREGSTVTDQAVGWGTGDNACALSSAFISAKARGYVK